MMVETWWMELMPYKRDGREPPHSFCSERQLEGRQLSMNEGAGFHQTLNLLAPDLGLPSVENCEK